MSHVREGSRIPPWCSPSIRAAFGLTAIAAAPTSVRSAASFSLMNSAVRVLPVPHAMITDPVGPLKPLHHRVDRLALIRPGPFRWQGPGTQIGWGGGQSTSAASRSPRSGTLACFSCPAIVRLAMCPIRLVVAINRRNENSGRADSDRNVFTSSLVIRVAGRTPSPGSPTGVHHGPRRPGRYRPRRPIGLATRPEPHAAKHRRVDRVVPQEPLTDALKLPARRTGRGPAGLTVTERRHGQRD